jgi:hypothetical protein
MSKKHLFLKGLIAAGFILSLVAAPFGAAQVLSADKPIKLVFSSYLKENFTNNLTCKFSSSPPTMTAHCSKALNHFRDAGGECATSPYARIPTQRTGIHWPWYRRCFS